MDEGHEFGAGTIRWDCETEPDMESDVDDWMDSTPMYQHEGWKIGEDSLLIQKRYPTFKNYCPNFGGRTDDCRANHCQDYNAHRAVLERESSAYRSICISQGKRNPRKVEKTDGRAQTTH